MDHAAKTEILDSLAKSLEVPDSAYELAVNRYRELGEWLHDKSRARCAEYEPVTSSTLILCANFVTVLASQRSRKRN